METEKYLWDIYLGGPWEKRLKEEVEKYKPKYYYKTIIKQAFPDKRIFDPEQRSAQNNGNWFDDDCFGVQHSLTMIAMIPDFPGSAIGDEMGMFYHRNNLHLFSKSWQEADELVRSNAGVFKPLEELVIIWPEFVKPAFAKKFICRMGYVVENPDDAIVLLRKAFAKYDKMPQEQK